jgi:photosystem II stability/assembly factor-like uncharacterized protein
VCGLLALGLGLLLAIPSRTEEPSAARDKEIAELEKQIAELNKKLAELRKAETSPPVGKTEIGLPESWVKTLHWRCIGPAAMGGRIVALSVFEADPSTYWVATASGGLLKTTNNGTTFEHQFDKEATVSIGDVAVAQSDRNIVWVGTGENNPRNSVSYGDGVYKSTDGGKTWKNMGLNKTFQIGKVVVHPKNPDIVYVGALGRLYGPNEDRGVYKTTDGGKTWNKVLYLDDKTGIIDLQMDPSEPETLLAAAWERKRDGFDSHPGNDMPPAEGYDRYDPITKWGTKGGIYRTTNGGKKWDRVTQGLPTCDTGRIGLDFYRKDSKVVYAIIDTAKIGMGTPPRERFLGVAADPEFTEGGVKIDSVTKDSPAAKAMLKVGDIIKAFDKDDVPNFNKLGELIQAKKAGDKVMLTIVRGTEILKIEVTIADRAVPLDSGRGPGGPGGRGGRFGAFAMFGAVTEDDAKGGAQITRLMEDGPAAKAGLLAGDVINMLDKQPVKDAANFGEMLSEKKAGDKVTIQYLRDKDTKEVVVTLAERGQQQGGTGGPTRQRPYSFQYGGQRENVQTLQGPNSHDYGGVYRSADGGVTWQRVNSINPRPMYFSVVRVDPSDEKYLYVLGISMYRSKDGGKTFKGDGANGVHPDQHCLWIDSRDGRHMIVGCDGGFYATYDRMDHWDFLNTMAIGQFYHVAVDSSKPYRAFGGLQDNGSWGGPSHSLAGRGPINEDWLVVGGGDGFVMRVDPNDPDLVYYESQDGNIARRNLRTGEGGRIRPVPPQGGGQGRGGSGYRFNWNTPFILSAHNPRIFYCAGNYVFRSLKQGADLKAISPEITRTKRGSGTAIVESPRNPDVLYAGTDDGNLWVTRDGGNKWTNLTDKMLEKKLIPGPRWVATIEPSRYKEGRCYVVLDAHRSDDDAPYVFMTDNYGDTWEPLHSKLPTCSTRCLREDIKNEDVLYVGTEFATFASLDRGKNWTKINNNLPTVAVHDFAQHPTAGEMVAATHGRSLWVLDVSALRQMKQETCKEDVKLFEPVTATRWRSEPEHGSVYGTGSKHWVGENPPRGAQIYYSLGKKPEKPVTLKVLDYTGQTVATLRPKNEPGLHKIGWDLTRGGGRGSGGPGGRGQGQGFGAFVAPGMYRVVLTVDGKDYAQGLRVEADPVLSATILAAEEEEKEPAKVEPKEDK